MTELHTKAPYASDDHSLVLKGLTEHPLLGSLNQGGEKHFFIKCDPPVAYSDNSKDNLDGDSK